MKVRIAVLTVFSLTMLAGLAAAQTPTPTPIDCDAIRCDVQRAINSQCDCNARNHGQYVSCVAHVVKALSVPTRCKGKIKRCAGNSTCGKLGFETCLRPRFGTCNVTTHLCPDGVTTCAADTDCIIGTKCTVMRSFPRNVTPTPGTDRCTLLGGVAGTGSCCAACP